MKACSCDVDTHDRVPLLVRGFDAGLKHDLSGIVHQDVELSELVFCQLNGGYCALLLADIRDRGFDPLGRQFPH